jgi:putative adenylate-forming enzyme
VDLLTVARVVRGRQALRRHDRWTPEELLSHQDASLRTLRDHAATHSPFYARMHRGLEKAPLDELPVVTKSALMEHFDEVVTDRDVRIADVEAYLARGDASRQFRDRYRVTATGGTTGRRGLFLSDDQEWLAITLTYARAEDWAGAAPGPTHRMRQAVVASRHLSHQSALVGHTSASRFLPTLRIDATDTLEDQVSSLNRFEPDIVVAYASCLRILAAEQSAGRLRIRPRAILAGSEVLTADSRTMIRDAFGVPPTNVYGATETGTLASDCRNGRMHQYADFSIAEIVDEANRPVGPGEYGCKMLVTVLFSRTLPLIRYELSDRVREVERDCPDHKPYPVLGGIDGRAEEVLTLGGVSVHPNVFDVALEGLPVTGWQVVEEDGALRVLLAHPEGSIVDENVVARLVSALARVGAHGVPVRVERVDSIARTAMGKAPLVVRRRSLEDHHED